MSLKVAIFTSGNRNNAIVVIARLRFSIITYLSKLTFPLHPIDMNLLFRGLACLADTHFVKPDTLLCLQNTAARAILQMREKGLRSRVTHLDSI